MKSQINSRALSVLFPEITAEWNYDKNKDLSPDTVTIGSNKKVWWQCNRCGNEWEATIYNRTKRGSGCPECAKRLISEKKNKSVLLKSGSFEDWCNINGDLGKKLLQQWDYEKNVDIKPSDITVGSHRQVYWKCPQGHSWHARIRDLITGHGCAVCANRQITEGVNDLATYYPDLVKEWDYEKNGNLLPTMISYGTDKQVWWKCEKCGNSWLASPNSRTCNGRGCPVCGHFKIDSDRTSLKAVNKSLAKEWNYEKNHPLTPEDVFPTSKKVVWWKCSICGNEWQAQIGNRNKGDMCPKCSPKRKTSFPEQAIYYYVKQSYQDAIIHYTGIFHNQMELDIYLPSIKTGIEYDGVWHKAKASAKRDQEKYKICKKNGIRLIRITEQNEDSLLKNCDILIKTDYTTRNIQELDNTLNDLSKYICLPEHNCPKDEYVIKETYYSILRKDSLASLFPELVNEWDYEKNNNLSPKTINAHSGQIVYWKCNNGHSWKAAIDSRTKGHGCPYCTGRKVLTGYNDLLSQNPELTKEWNYEKNSELKPSDIHYNSMKKVWWKCSSCGYEWMTTVFNRNQKNYQCPVCSNHTVAAGINDLATTNPELIKEWDYEKNTRTPQDVVAGSAKKVWWKCQNGHSWQAEIRSRVKGRKCPYCDNRSHN